MIQKIVHRFRLDRRNCVCPFDVVLMYDISAGRAAVALAAVRTRGAGRCRLAGPRQSVVDRRRSVARGRATDEADQTARAGKCVGNTLQFIFLTY